ncbi:MAG: hypothetical protein HYT76_08505 [Deltaproteobacteria bacterium]|nr:hypothetical protein [Deltaproteobacteria bacterium]
MKSLKTCLGQIGVGIVVLFLLASIGCEKQIKPARVISPGDDNTKLCKQSYLDCRSKCYPVEDDEDRYHCADLCEKDVDSCLLQARNMEK